MVTSRLMEISIKLDNYIYLDKPLAESDAAEYLREITSYKDISSKDARSLQVIEKLTRIIKGIIAEQKELNRDNTNELIGNTSPVYSLPDEDRTEHSIPEIPNVLENMEAVDIGEEIIEILSDDDIQVDNEAENIDIDIHDAVANLSITNDENIISTNVDYNECSQSILNNIENVEMQSLLESNLKENNEKSNHNATKDITTPIIKNNKSLPKPILITRPDKTIIQDKMRFNPDTKGVASLETANKRKNCVSTIANSNSDTSEKFTFKAPKIKLMPNKPLNSQIATNNFIVIEAVKSTFGDSYTKFCQEQYKLKTSKEVNPVIKKTHVHSMATSKNNKKNIPEQGNIMTNYYSNASQVNMNKNYEVKAMAINPIAPKVLGNVNKSISIDNHKITTGNKRKSTKNTNANFQNQNSHNIPGSTAVLSQKNVACKSGPKKPNQAIEKPKRRKRKNIDIYNKNTENDLSWMEGIRFVREVRLDEFDPKLTSLEESFWDNYCLPSDWDDHDFD